MNPEKFHRMITAPARTQQELEQVLRNALERNERERAHEVKQVLDRRFPDWERPTHRRGGATQTIARFGNVKQSFRSAKEAYLWMVERFADANPGLFSDLRWETTGFVAVGRQCGASGPTRNYFARQSSKLFRKTKHLAEDHNNYHQLSNGWYANTNLSNAEKFEILCRFGGVSKLEYEADWAWEVLEPSDALLERKSQLALAREIFAELQGESNAQRKNDASAA
jgi:hypothetical protein